MSLRARVIRLAAEDADLRPHLLPILKVAVKDGFDAWAKDRKFRNPETGNNVGFSALPPAEQKKERAKFHDKNHESSLEDARGASQAMRERRHMAEAARDKAKGLRDQGKNDAADAHEEEAKIHDEKAEEFLAESKKHHAEAKKHKALRNKAHKGD